MFEELNATCILFFSGCKGTKKFGGKLYIEYQSYNLKYPMKIEKDIFED